MWTFLSHGSLCPPLPWDTQESLYFSLSTDEGRWGRIIARNWSVTVLNFYPSIPHLNEWCSEISWGQPSPPSLFHATNKFCIYPFKTKSTFGSFFLDYTPLSHLHLSLDFFANLLTACLVRFSAAPYYFPLSHILKPDYNTMKKNLSLLLFYSICS